MKKYGEITNEQFNGNQIFIDERHEIILDKRNNKKKGLWTRCSWFFFMHHANHCVYLIQCNVISLIYANTLSVMLFEVHFYDGFFVFYLFLRLCGNELYISCTKIWPEWNYIRQGRGFHKRKKNAAHLFYS